MAPSTCPNEVTESGDENLWNPDVTRTWPQAPLLLPIFVCGSKTPVVRVKNRAALRLLSPTEGQSCSISFSKEIRFLQFWALRYSRLRWLDIYIYICRERERARESMRTWLWVMAPGDRTAVDRCKWWTGRAPGGSRAHPHLSSSDI